MSEPDCKRERSLLYLGDVPICTLLSAKLGDGCLPGKLNTHNLQFYFLFFSTLTCFRKFLPNRNSESF